MDLPRFTSPQEEYSMVAQNPYTAPKANVAGAEAFGEIRVFSAKGRLGRVRYIGYTVGLTMVVALVMGVLIAALSAGLGETAALPVMLAGYGLIILIQVLLSIQRAHDFNTTGWLAILAFVPLINLLFWVIPGTDGENRFGLKPPPNGAGAILLACILPLIFVIGIVAAIAIPAYQQYVERAATTQQQQ
jgi:uncharacterized membrane protein YhaH (DUF805 family)